MLKSRLWHEVLDLAICWRFFKYKLVLNDTEFKFVRDKDYLGKSKIQQQEYNQCPTQDAWQLPFDVDKVVNRIDHVMADLKHLLGPLKEITQMVIAP